jgi:proline racemase
MAWSVTTPVTVPLDVPAGLVVVDVAVREDGAATASPPRVPSFPVRLDASVEVAGLGEVGYDLAFGGNFYAIVALEKLGLPFERSAGPRLLEAGLSIMDAINAADRPVHPLDPTINGCHHVYLEAPGSDAGLAPRHGHPPAG